jgi:hypothetical protein
MSETREFAALKQQKENLDNKTRLMRRVILGLFMLLVVLLLLLPVLVESELSRRPSRPIIDRIASAVSDVPGVRGVGDVQIIDLDEHDLPVLRLVYLTAERDEIGYRAEIVEVFRAVGEIVMGTDLELAQVRLVPSVQLDEPIEVISVPAQKLRALEADDITRTEFLAELDIETVRGVGAHTDIEPDI